MNDLNQNISSFEIDRYRVNKIIFIWFLVEFDTFVSTELTLITEIVSIYPFNQFQIF